MDGLKWASVTSSSLYYDSNVASDSSSWFQLFADCFASLFKVVDIPTASFDYKLNLVLSKSVFTSSDIEKKLEDFNPSKDDSPMVSFYLSGCIERLCICYFSTPGHSFPSFGIYLAIYSLLSWNIALLSQCINMVIQCKELQTYCFLEHSTGLHPF